MTRLTAVHWTQRARRDLRDIGDFISLDKPEAAAKWVGRILDTVDRLSTFPNSGRVVPEAGRDDVREVILETYRIVYRIRKHDITVLTVFEGHHLYPRNVVEGTHTEE